MNDLFDLLNINQGIIRDFPLQASRIVDHQVEKVINRNVSKLRQIASSFNEPETLTVASQIIAQIIRKVRESAKIGDVFYKSWTARELRILSYYLMELQDDPTAFHHALSLLESHWRNLYLRGLVSYLLNSWNSIKLEYREVISQLVMQKLMHYEGNNRRYLLWKDKANFFDPNGPKRMVAMLCAKNMDVTDAPTLLGFKEKTFNRSYYSEVMSRYVEKKAITDLSMVEELFTQHDLNRTKKLVLAYLVEQADRYGDEIRRSLLCRFINAQLGDVTLSATWAPFPGATEEEAQRLKEAMRLVNVWYAQKIIETFFELCVQDKERKIFWLNYVPYISGFKIVGSTSTKRLLQCDSRIADMIERYFIKTNSRTIQTSALVLFMKGKMLVEFSDKGALYVYNQHHRLVACLQRSRSQIESINDLKAPDIQMQLLVEPNTWGGYYYRTEGRLTHRGNWQDRLRLWIQEIVLSKIEQDTHKNLTKYVDNVFYRLEGEMLSNGASVVLGTNGFYIKCRNNRFVLIKEQYINVSSASELIFIGPKKNGWSEISYFSNCPILIHIVGYISVFKDGIYYKTEQNDTNFMLIRI